ncbi:MAG: hypothetical protein Q7T29_11000 [Gallionella sp.]|nr:hypothetical protein [Gallionella sp.]
MIKNRYPQRQDITALPTHKVIAAGVACILEGRKVFPKLTAEENLRLGAYQEPSDAITQERMEEIFRLFPRLGQQSLIFLSGYQKEGSVGGLLE